MPMPEGMSPAPPPEVAAQMKPQLPFAGIGQQVASPQNQTSMRFEAVKKVLDSMAKEDPKLAPFVKRAMDILQSGIEASMGTQPSPAGPGKTEGPPEAFPG